MEETYAIRRYEQASALLPLRWQQAAAHIPEEEKGQAEEFRLRTGKPLTVLLPDGEKVLCEELLSMSVTRADLEQLCDTVTGYSRYAVGDTLSQGYLTARGGFRIGVCGTAVMREGRNTYLRDISSAVIRIGRERQGVGAPLLSALWKVGRFHSTLLLSPPGGGKTTLLRDLIRLLSDGTAEFPPQRVALVDERGEIAVMHQGTAQMSVGSHTDVLDACPKAIGIPILLRAANPQIIAVDEITEAADLQAMIAAANCGVQMLATIHAANRQELERKPLFAEVVSAGVFTRLVTISVVEGRRIYEVEEL